MRRSTEQLMQEAYDQCKQDRVLTRNCYDKFSEQVQNIGDYAVAGQNLNKCLEILSKQSAQLLELAKLSSTVRKNESDTTLSAEENEKIYEEIN